MSRSVLDLGAQPWLFGQAPRQSFSQPADDRSSVAEWLPARVPGDVRADLVAAGRIPPLDTIGDIAATAWVDDGDWWYRTELETAEPGTTMVLEADGIDYSSSIWLDGQLLSTHQGMFAQQSLVLPPLIQEHGKHELAVRIWGAGALPRLSNSLLRRTVRKALCGLGLTSEYFPDRMSTPKAQFSFGWDFSPRVLSAGIWDDIRLVQCRGAYLADVSAQAEPLADTDPTPVRWTVQLRVVPFESARLHARVELHDRDGGRVELLQDRFDLGGVQDPVLTFQSASLARWWPWDQGEPHLYWLTIRLSDERGALDEKDVTVGVRTVRRERFEGGQPWRFTVNGRPVFLRGANWVPADILPGRVNADDYARLIGQARAAGINFLRIWGGGIREKAAFWEQCNASGIMVMQEFPLACAFLDHYPRDSGYLSVLESETKGIVRRLRNHSSLIAWCGGNEISPRRERRPLRAIRRVLEREDPARPWIPASPSQGDIHQWDVWHSAAPWQALSQVTAPFMSEFGLQALPQVETIREMFPAGVPTSLDDPAWSERKLQASKLRHYAGPAAEKDWVTAAVTTQRTQSVALQAGIEACRLRRERSGHSHPCGGVAFWQFNEPWPVVSWSVVDRMGRPKAAYEMLLHSYQPVLIAARFEWRQWRAGDRFQAEIWIVNDTPQLIEPCTVDASLDGQTICRCERVTCPAGSGSCIGQVDVPLEASPFILKLVCSRQGEVIAANQYDLAVYLPPRQPLVSWLTRRAVDLLLQLD